MKIDIITIFPEMFSGPFDLSIIKRAREKGFVEINIHNLRKWAKDKRGTVDDRPYGGGVGMVMMVEPIVKAIKEIKDKKLKIKNTNQKSKIILLSPRGKVWKQEIAQKYSTFEHLILICGHYEGVDERIKNFIDEEISIGDFVLTGGEIPAMVLVDSIVRLIPNVLKKSESTEIESFSNSQLDNLTIGKLLEHPQYTRPECYEEMKVPEILLSGNHKEIEKWRKEKALEITNKIRPDLLKDK